MWGSILSSLATSLLPFAAKKLATIPLANQIYKSVTPILSSVIPQITKSFEQNEKKQQQPVIVIQKQTYQSPVQQDDTPDKIIRKPKKYGKMRKNKYGQRKNYI